MSVGPSHGQHASQGGARSKLSRNLVALWADDYVPAMQLLRRVFPHGLLQYLSQPVAGAGVASDSSGQGRGPSAVHGLTPAQVRDHLILLQSG